MFTIFTREFTIISGTKLATAPSYWASPCKGPPFCGLGKHQRWNDKLTDPYDFGEQCLLFLIFCFCGPSVFEGPKMQTSQASCPWFQTSQTYLDRWGLFISSRDGKEQPAFNAANQLHLPFTGHMPILIHQCEKTKHDFISQSHIIFVGNIPTLLLINHDKPHSLLRVIPANPPSLELSQITYLVNANISNPVGTSRHSQQHVAPRFKGPRVSQGQEKGVISTSRNPTGQ